MSMFYGITTAALAAETRIPETVRRQIDAASLFRNAALDSKMHQWQKIVESLYAMLSYREDWDGMGSPSPDRDIISSAIGLLSQLKVIPEYPVPTRVVATPAGTIGIEWQLPDRYLEVEITEPKLSQWMMIGDGEMPAHWTIEGTPLLIGRPS